MRRLDAFFFGICVRKSVRNVGVGNIALKRYYIFG